VPAKWWAVLALPPGLVASLGKCVFSPAQKNALRLLSLRLLQEEKTQKIGMHAKRCEREDENEKMPY
jgi:hypothetical protein